MLIMLILYSIKFVHSGDEPKGIESDKNLFIQVDGDIKNPGVYSFNQGPKLKDLIDKAGGVPPDEGCFDGLNHHNFHSGDKVNVSWDGEKWNVSVKAMSSFQKLTLGIPISLNSETEIGLTAIPGVGPKLAKRIIEEKERRGGFKKLRDLMAVQGISAKKYIRIVPWITL